MKIFRMLLAVMSTAMIGGMLSCVAGFDAIVGMVFLPVVAMLFPLGRITEGGLMAGLYPEVWTGELIKQFRIGIESIGWLHRIRSFDSYTRNNVLNFTEIGGDPTVLINNSTYPLEVEELADNNKAITLDKYQTKPTKITDDELHGLGYDKFGSVIERHSEVINETKYKKALHSLAPSGNSEKTPVILTSGGASADGLRKRIKVSDIIAMKEAFDKMKVPQQGRVLVLCPEHVSDLLLEDREFQVQYNNYTTGKIANLYGFEVYEYVDAPSYTVSSKKKLAYGGAESNATRHASICFYAPRMMRAEGETKTYLQDASTSPTTQENLVSFRHYFVCLPLKEEGIGAIVSNVNG